MDWFGSGRSPDRSSRDTFRCDRGNNGNPGFPDCGGEACFAVGPAVAKKLRTQSLRVAWIALAITLLSGVIWLLLQAVSMSGLPPGEAMTSQVLSTVLNETQFGVVTEIRSVLAIILAACLAL